MRHSLLCYALTAFTLHACSQKPEAPPPNRAEAPVLVSALALDTVYWPNTCSRMDGSSIPQVHDLPFSDLWNARFHDWFQQRMERHLGSAECEPTYEEWLEEAKRTKCNGREWVGINTCEEQLAWCDSVGPAEAREWYEVIANPQFTSYFGSAFTVSANTGTAVSLVHRDWMGQYRYSTHAYATTVHPSSGLEVPPEWAYAHMDRKAWRKAILEVYPFDIYVADSSGPDLEWHRGIYAPSELVDYEFHLSDDSVYSLVSLYGAGGSYDMSIPMCTWDPESLDEYMMESMDHAPEVRSISRLAWLDSTRCFHMERDSLPEFLPHARFADANRAARQFRRAAIGSKDQCCRDKKSDGIDCRQEGYWHETTWLRYEVMQCDADVVSVLLVAAKNWGGSGVFRKSLAINVSGNTGWPLTPPETLRNVPMAYLSGEMKRVFIEGKACLFNETSWSQDIDQLSDWYQKALENKDAFVVKDGEWHWVINGHPDHCNAGQRTWAIPTGVGFAP